MPATPATTPENALEEDARKATNTLWQLLCGPEVLCAILTLDPVEGREQVTFQAEFTFTIPPSAPMRAAAKDLLETFSRTGPWGLKNIRFTKKALRMLLVHKQIRSVRAPQCS